MVESRDIVSSLQKAFGVFLNEEPPISLIEGTMEYDSDITILEMKTFIKNNVKEEFKWISPSAIMISADVIANEDYLS